MGHLPAGRPPQTIRTPAPLRSLHVRRRHPPPSSGETGSSTPTLPCYAVPDRDRRLDKRLPALQIDPTMLNVGSQAPDFTVTLGSEERFTLSENRGGNVVLFFYPRAFTHGCTVEVGGFCESYEDLTAHNAVVIGISTDSVNRLRRFGDATGAPVRPRQRLSGGDTPALRRPAPFRAGHLPGDLRHRPRRGDQERPSQRGSDVPPHRELAADPRKPRIALTSLSPSSQSHPSHESQFRVCRWYAISPAQRGNTAPQPASGSMEAPRCNWS